MRFFVSLISSILGDFDSLNWLSGNQGHFKPGLFERLSQDQGFPDGSTVDADGGLWNAQWDGACVVRYGADGAETDRLGLPTQRPTCPAFGGPALDRLFVSTARTGLSDAALAEQPSAGGVFALAPGRRGLAEHRFITTLRA